MTSDDDRIAYLAGEAVEGDVDDDDRVELDELRALLADRSLWEEPDPALEDAVVAGIPASPERRERPKRLAGLRALTAVAAMVAVALAAVAVLGDGSDRAQFEAALSGTELAPGARGNATFTRTGSGWRIELEVTGLPRRDDGAFYQAWLRGDVGDLVAVGTFNAGPDVVLWSGVSPADHPTITITEEVVDDDPGSSGRRVLVGSVSR